MQRSAYLVLPFELGPHGAELDIGAGGGRDVVHDVDVDVVQDHHAALRVPCGLVHDVPKDGARLGRRHLDVRPGTTRAALLSSKMQEAFFIRLYRYGPSVRV